MQKIVPFMWVDGQAEEVTRFYTSVFKHSRIGHITRYGDVGPGPEGTVMSVTFLIDGQEFVALNGGPNLGLVPAISFFVNCETQREVDELWEKLSQGGEQLRCGWVKDKYGVSWQIIPKGLREMLSDADTARSARVMKAMLQMGKIDIQELRQAYESQESWVEQGARK
jgi:predicted 3-demethylubiquinone-9 3-methyltransferase (glyoxalase superfamily)